MTQRGHQHNKSFQVQIGTGIGELLEYPRENGNILSVCLDQRAYALGIETAQQKSGKSLNSLDKPGRMSGDEMHQTEVSRTMNAIDEIIEDEGTVAVIRRAHFLLFLEE